MIIIVVIAIAVRFMKVYFRAGEAKDPTEKRQT